MSLSPGQGYKGLRLSTPQLPASSVHCYEMSYRRQWLKCGFYLRPSVGEQLRPARARSPYVSCFNCRNDAQRSELEHGRDTAGLSLLSLRHPSFKLAASAEPHDRPISVHRCRFAGTLYETSLQLARQVAHMFPKPVSALPSWRLLSGDFAIVIRNPQSLESRTWTNARALLTGICSRMP